MRKKVIIIAGIVVLVLAALVFIPKIMGGNSLKASIVPRNLNQWARLQQVYFAEHQKVGASNDIGWGGYDDPMNVNDRCKEKKCFSFYSDFIPTVPAVPLFGVPGVAGKSTFCAKNNEDIGGCKAGNKWCIIATEGKIKYIEPEDKSCIKLIPTEEFLL